MGAQVSCGELGRGHLRRHGRRDTTSRAVAARKTVALIRQTFQYSGGGLAFISPTFLHRCARVHANPPFAPRKWGAAPIPAGVGSHPH